MAGTVFSRGTMQHSIATSDADDLCARIVGAVADATGEDPATMTPPLGSVVDVEALTAVVDSADSVTVTFEYRDHAVLVAGDGTVSVRERGDAATGDVEVVEERQG